MYINVLRLFGYVLCIVSLLLGVCVCLPAKASQFEWDGVFKPAIHVLIMRTSYVDFIFFSGILEKTKNFTDQISFN